MPVAENRFTVTKSLFVEGQVKVFRDGYGVTVKRAVGAVFIAWLVLAVVTLMLEISLIFVGVEALVLVLASFWIYVMIPRSRAKSSFRAFQSRHGDDLSRVTGLYEEYLVVHANGGAKKIHYRDIEKILYSKNLMILIAEDHTGVMLKIDSFTKGDQNTVTQLIDKAKTEEIEDA